MGSITYDFIANSIFSHQDSISNRFKNESEDRLKKELENYRDFCIKNYDTLIVEIRNKQSSLKVFTSTENTPIRLLKQTALYIEQFILPDPLFRLSESRPDLGQVMSKYLGFEQSGLDKNKLAEVCEYLNAITPMVAGNYTKLFPLSYYFERPSIPFYVPKDGFSKILPLEILSFFHENAIVFPLSKLSSGGWAVVEKDLKPCRGISVDFKGSDISTGMVYFLFESEVIETNEETMEVIFRQTLPDTIPEKDEFNAWVQQSINSASKKYYDEVYLENIIAASLNSTYLSDNDFTSNLIDHSFKPKETIESYTASHIINIDLPFITKINTEKLMFIREEEGDVFKSFRLELEKQFRELKLISDEKQLKLKAEHIFHELNEVQGHKIERKMNHLTSQMKINSLLAVGGLAASIQTAGISLLATAIAAGKGYKDYLDYKEKVTENPAYLLWKVK